MSRLGIELDLQAGVSDPHASLDKILFKIFLKIYYNLHNKKVSWREKIRYFLKYFEDTIEDTILYIFKIVSYTILQTDTGRGLATIEFFLSLSNKHPLMLELKIIIIREIFRPHTVI